MNFTIPVGPRKSQTEPEKGEPKPNHEMVELFKDVFHFFLPKFFGDPADQGMAFGDKQRDA